MNKAATNHLYGVLLLVAALAVLAACGGEKLDSSLTDPDPEETLVNDNAPSSGSNDAIDQNDTIDEDAASNAPADTQVATAEPEQGETVVGSSNMGGEIVDPKPHLIDDIAIAESYPEQLIISFTAGDEPCVAATATALASESQVRVVLEAGITTDALVKSCLAGHFPHTLTIALAEGLDGRELVTQQPDTPADGRDNSAGDRQADSTEGAEDPAAGEEGAPPAPAFETTLVGMGEQAAKEASESFGYRWRIMAIDGEELIGTADYDEGRVNVKIVSGVVTEAWLG